jgi:hypothetical protein
MSTMNELIDGMAQGREWSAMGDGDAVRTLLGQVHDERAASSLRTRSWLARSRSFAAKPASASRTTKSDSAQCSKWLPKKPFFTTLRVESRPSWELGGCGEVVEETGPFSQVVKVEPWLDTSPTCAGFPLVNSLAS